jgi:hypothetical protein
VVLQFCCFLLRFPSVRLKPLGHPSWLRNCFGNNGLKDNRYHAGFGVASTGDGVAKEKGIGVDKS